MRGTPSPTPSQHHPGTAAARAPHAPARPSAADARILRGIIALGAFLVLIAWISGSNPAALVLAVVFACTAQGWWRGGGEIAGLLIGTVLALLVAPALGPGFDAPVAALFGTAGVQTRAVGITLTFVAVMLTVTVAARFGARRWMRGRAARVRWNRAAGAGIGLVEGSILGLALLWIPLALEPVARARLGAEDAGNPAARRVVNLAQQVRDSGLGRLAERTSPLRGSEILAMAEDFAIVSRHRAAMAFFVDQPVMRRVKELPSTTTLRPLKF